MADAGEGTVLRRADLAAPREHPRDMSPCFGRWVNADADAAGISRIQCTPGPDEALHVEVWGADGTAWPRPHDVRPYGTSPSDGVVRAFSAHFTHPTHGTTVQANLKGGVMVVAAFHAHEGAPRFTREFLALQGPA